MRYLYWKPAADLCPFIGSYYAMENGEDVSDVIRVEIPHVRIVVAGQSVVQHEDRSVVYRAPSMIVCGPSMKAGVASVSANSAVVGASITPLGWQALFGIAVSELASRKAELDDFHRVNPAQIQDRLLNACNDSELFGVMDDLFRSLLIVGRPVDEAFVAAATQWLLDRGSPGIGELARSTELSHRQLDRLCNRYFGASPKRLQRVFRALHVSNHLAWTGETDWRHAVGEQFYDQSHFIKDFKELIGCTPGEFVRGRNMMIRFDLMKRLEISHQSRYSLIG